MREDKKRFYTLDEDIVKLWREHGWEVLEIKVNKKDEWIIKAKYIKNIKDENK